METNQKPIQQPYIEMTSLIYHQMLEYAAHIWPNEACGILAGSYGSRPASAPHILINAMYPIKNQAEHTRTAFSFSPEDWTKAYYNIQKNRQALVGFFHSHPSTPPLLSRADQAGIQWASVPTYWIISFASGVSAPHVQVYRQASGSWMPSVFAQVGVQIP